MICEAGFALVMDKGKVVLKLNPLFGDRHYNVSGTFQKPIYENDFFHVVGVIDKIKPWDKCNNAEWCNSINSHKYHSDLRLTLYINARFIDSVVCHACGAWTSLDASGLGAAAFGGYGFYYGKADKTGCTDPDGIKSNNCFPTPENTNFEWKHDDTEKIRRDYECEKCSDPQYNHSS